MTLKSLIFQVFQLKKIVFSASLLLFIFSSCSGSKKIFSDIKEDLSSSPVFNQGFAGLVVYDPQEQKMIFEHNPKKYFTPASNTKLFTFYAGLKILGDSIPGLRYTIQNDSLLFKSTGDPSLLNSELPESKIFSFLKQSDKQLFYLPANSSEKVFGPGWAWDDYNAAYSVERSTFPVYGNKVSFQFHKEENLPKVVPNQFKDSLIRNNSDYSRVTRKIGANLFEYSIQNESWKQEVPFKTSETLSISLLQDTLQKKIITLDSKKFRPKKTLYSIHADSLYKKMLVESDNFIAEQILLLAAEELSDTLQTSIAIAHTKKHFLKDLPDKTLWVDGSGLSRYNLTTPRNMIKLLEKIKNEVSYSRLFKLLPQGGKTGTLKTLFKAENPFIYAKTGSLSNNYSLSGYLITKKGKILLFSFMNSNFTVASASLKREVEQILTKIRDNY
jgi:serine-type D-Ala-D-Ala carboxypeptidase/endopeptidase (penicillin-binding protein 4)